jgi:hypothetical protein
MPDRKTPQGESLQGSPSMVAAMPSVRLGDPLRGLTAAELGTALGISEAEALRKEAESELFSVCFPTRGSERVFPAFQAWPGIVGAPLSAVLEGLRVKIHGGSMAFAFFAGTNDALGYLTPVEMLIGSVTRARSLERWVDDGLSYPADQRLAIVLRAAEAFGAAQGES